MLSLCRGGLLAAILWLLCATTTQAQLFYDITLSAEQVPAMGPQPTYIAQVVDARANKSGLGWLSNGLDNTRKLARFRQGLEQELTQFFKQITRSADARPLVLVVRRLGLAEQAANLQEFALAEVVADFYYLHPDGYHLVHQATELTIDQAFDVTSLHSQTIARALLQALAPLKDLRPEQTTAGPGLTWEQVLAGPAPATYPVQTAPALRPGLYQTVADFQQNTPQKGVEGKTKPWGRIPGTVSIEGTLPVRVKTRSNLPDGPWYDAEDLWGFCDGKQVYVRHGSNFYPLIRTKTGYEYRAPVYLDPRQKSTTVIYVPGRAITRGSPHFVAATLRLWPDTGFASEDIPVTTRADAPAAVATVVIYRRPDAAPERPVQVLLDGALVGVLHGGEYLSLPMTAGTLAEISVCGRTEGEACFRFRPDLRAANYLNCRVSTATQPAPTLRLVSPETGLAAIQSCTAAIPQK